MLTVVLTLLSTGPLFPSVEAPHGPPPAPTPGYSWAIETRSAASSSSDTLAAPPGMVQVRGGRTKVGIDADDVEPLIVESNIRKLVGETPEHQVQVDDFYLMVTEVTNEQYEVFVRNAGGKVPRSWGIEALAAAAADYAREQHEAKEAARAAGEPFETVQFDPVRWWDQNWHEVDWQVPEGRETLPVEFVDYEAAQTYASWAGLRLMTEHEFQRAGRGNGDDPFPWGDDWEEGHCSTLENAGPLPAPVGSFADGATSDGVYDLLGNVWEWTSSPYIAYPGYEPISVQFDRRRSETCLTSWDANQRVVVGGSYKTPRVAARLTTRRATERWQATDAMGFRCAASPRPGTDVMRAVIDAIPGHSLPEDVRYNHALVVSMDRWTASAGNSDVEGYRVISDYDHFSFLPVDTLGVGGIEPLRELSHSAGPQHFGAVTFTRPIVEPALEPGTYYVAWRGAGVKPVRGGGEGEDPEPVEEGVYVDPENPIWSTEVDTLVFYNTEGEAVLAQELPTDDLVYDRLREGSVSLTRWEATSEEDIEAGVPPHQELRFSVTLPGSSRKGFMLSMLFKLSDGALDAADWRLP